MKNKLRNVWLSVLIYIQAEINNFKLLNNIMHKTFTENDFTYDGEKCWKYLVEVGCKCWIMFKFSCIFNPINDIDKLFHSFNYS